MLFRFSLLLIAATFFTAATMGCGNRDVAIEPDSADDAGRVIAVGADIDDVLALMKPYGDGGPLLAMAVDGPDLGMKQWSVDKGVLSAVYTISTNEIARLIFHLSDWRQPRGERMYFDFDVVSFRPDTNEMLIQTADLGEDEE